MNKKIEEIMTMMIEEEFNNNTMQNSKFNNIIFYLPICRYMNLCIYMSFIVMFFELINNNNNNMIRPPIIKEVGENY